jgi:hypothetical protein
MAKKPFLQKRYQKLPIDNNLAVVIEIEDFQIL